LPESGAEHAAPGNGAATAATCETCGEPAVDGELCETCRQAFTSLLVSSTPAPPAEPVSVIPDAAPVEESPAEKSPAKESPSAEPMSSSPSPDDTAGAAAAAWAQQALPDMAPWSGKSDAASQGSVAPVPQRRKTRSMALAAAAVLAVVAAVGAPQGARWLGIEWPSLAAGQEQSEQPTLPNAPATSDPAPEDQAAPVMAQEAPSTRPASTASTQPRAAAPRPATAARQPNPSTRQVASAAAPTPALEARALDAAPAPATLAAPEPLPSPAPAAPTGRFFEPGDVDEMPRIVTRVEPQLPGDLAARSFSDVVVVRVLVSQSGHPFRVGLLRRSKLGPSLDDAVIEAVGQWKFSPALKRGEPVSAWYNIGLPLGGN
jgi:outer membrane biosynthesis protein TonB